MTTRACDRSCKFWRYDMDGAYCAHPKSYKIGLVFCASTSRMSRDGHCMSGYDDPAKNTLALWEPSP